MKYNILSKSTFLVLFIIGAIISAVGVAIGFLGTADNLIGELMLDTTYIYAGITAAAVALGVLIIGGINNPMSLLKIFVCLVASVVIIAIVYLIAPSDAMTMANGNVIDEGTVKFTNTVIYLTYLLLGCTFTALVAGWIIGAVRK